MKIKSFDHVIFIAAALTLVVLSVHVYSQPLQASLVRVKVGDRSWVYPLDQERRVQPLGKPGTCVIEINDDSARVFSPRRIHRPGGSCRGRIDSGWSGLVRHRGESAKFRRLPRRSRGDMWEVALWEDVPTGNGNELYYTYQVYNEAIVVPENVDAIRALTGTIRDGAESIHVTDKALDVQRDFLVR